MKLVVVRLSNVGNTDIILHYKTKYWTSAGFDRSNRKLIRHLSM